MNRVSVRFLLLLLLWTVEGNIRGSSVQEGRDAQNGYDDYLNAVPDYDVNIPKIHFCCDRHYYFKTMNATCMDSGQYLEPNFYSMDGDPLEEESVNYRNLTEFNKCASFLLPKSEFQLLENGRLMMKAKNEFDYPGSVIIDETFCLIWTGQNGTYEMSALICFPEENETDSLLRTVIQYYLFPIGMSISALFLAATYVVYCLVGELQDLLGKSFMCSVASLFLSKVFGVIAKLFGSAMSKGACAVVGMLMHLGFLHSFFWLNVISFIVFFSIWCQGKISKCSRRRWFAFACIYAFGVPLLILALILIHDLTTQFDHLRIPKPGFSVKSCGFSNRGAQLVYFYAPITILLGVNLILFCLSACKLFFLAKQSSACTFQFKHYLKLLVLMGIPWIFEVLSFFFATMDKLSVSTFVWLIFDVFNSLQGVIIFIVFACRRPVLAKASEAICGANYAKEKYPDIFLKQTCEETADCRTVDLRLTDADKKQQTNDDPI